MKTSDSINHNVENEDLPDIAKIFTTVMMTECKVLSIFGIKPKKDWDLNRRFDYMEGIAKKALSVYKESLSTRLSPIFQKETFDSEYEKACHYIEGQIMALQEMRSVEEEKMKRRALRKRRFVMAMKIAYFLCVALITVMVGVEENSVWSCLGVVFFSGALYSWMAGKSRQSGRRIVRR